VEPAGGPESAPREVTILGSGFSAASSVSFGGVPASFKVLNSYEIAATPPAFSARTSCAPLPSSGVYEGENAGNDICQAQVQVSDAAGASATSTILPPLEGPIAFDAEGAFVTPVGCGCEVRPAPSEFDYVPTPQITSVSSAAGPAGLADESGGTLITVHGSGLNFLTMNWADVGDPALESSQISLEESTAFKFLSGTEMQIEAPALIAPGEAPSVNPLSRPLSVFTQAGQSPSATLTYAGVPSVTNVTNPANPARLKGAIGAADTGGTPIELSGEGFAGQLQRVQFIDSEHGASQGTQFAFTTDSNSSLTTQTVAQSPGLVDVEACTASGCSSPSSVDLMYLYAPGAPEVTSVAPASGAAAGHTKVVIRGQNLGCALGVFFGEAEAAFTQVPAKLEDCGAATVLDATSPPGKAGEEVPVTLTTVESFFTGSGHGTSGAEFTYRK